MGLLAKAIVLTLSFKLELKFIMGPHDIVCIHRASPGTQNKATPGIRNQVDLVAFKDFFIKAH